MSEVPKPMIVAVDGPAGSGKSSVCAEVSRRLGWRYINTGFLYRAIAYLCLQQKLDLKNGQLVSQVARDFRGKCRWDDHEGRLFFDDQDLTPHLHLPEVGAAASSIAGLPEMREELLPLQRHLGANASPGAILDGRDIGTVVFPDASLKIYLSASIEERAKRRWQQLGADANQDITKIEADIRARDDNDAGRSTAPLKQAQDAVFIDSSSFSMDQVVDMIIRLVKSRV